MLKFIDRVERYSKKKQLLFFSFVFVCTVSFGVFVGTFMKFMSVTQLLDRQKEIRKEQEKTIQKIVKQSETGESSVIIKQE